MRQLRWYFAPLAVSIAGAVLLVYGAFQIEALMRQFRWAEADNTTWRFSQLEVDLLKFEREATRSAAPQAGAAELADLRIAGNVFLSRLDVIDQVFSGSDSVLGDAGRLEPARRQWFAIYGVYKPIATLLDADDAALRAGLPALKADIRRIAPDVRQFSLGTLMQIVAQSEATRVSLESLLWKFAGGSILIIILLIGETWLLIYLLGNLKRRTAANERNRAMLERMIEASLDAMIVTDRRRIIKSFNGAAEMIFGYTAREAVGRDFAELIVPHRMRHADRLLGGRNRRPGASAIIDRGRIILPARRKDGGEFPVEAAIISGIDDRGEPIFFGFLRDVSERMQIERSLKNARDAALRNEEAKSRFLGVVSHEMRTPLNGLIAALDVVMQTTALTEKQSRFLAIARDCSTTALEQIDDLLELTRLGGKEDEVAEPVEFDLRAALSDIVAQSEPLAARRGNSIKLDTPARMLAGPRRLFTRVLFNLIGNAIKFTENGLIVVRATVTPEGADLVVRIEVTDSGIGIAPEDQKRIFLDFETLDSGYRRTVQGSGLGLGIAKRAVERMRGEIGVTSSPGVGSTFWFTARMAPGQGQPPAPAEAPPRRATAGAGAATRLSVLVVEDGPVNRIVLREMLEHLGHRVAEAENGREALARLAAEPFGLVFMDISMPVLDGVAATRQIRAEALAEGTPIVGLTAFAEPSEMAKFREAGMQAVLTKPLTFDALRDFLQGFATADGLSPPAEEVTLDRRVVGDLKAVLGQELFGRTRERFLTETRDFLARIGQAAEAGDLGTVEAIAHQGVGSAGTFGAARLCAALREIAAGAKAGDLPGIGRNREAAGAAFQMVEAELSAL